MPRLQPSVREPVRQALSSIGYRDEWLHESYEYVDLQGDRLETQAIELAAFAHYPPSYREACIGITQSLGEPDPANAVRHRALGAPLIFDVGEQLVRAWSIRATGPPQKVGEDFPVQALPEEFEKHRSTWSPLAIRQARRPDKRGFQLDFLDQLLLPRLACEFQARLQALLEDAVTEVRTCFRALYQEPPPSRFLFPYLFRFVVAKVFRDRNDVPGWNSSDPRTLFLQAEQHCQSGLMDALPKEFLNPELLAVAWMAISEKLQFQNFSLPDLFFIYESCFIDRETRKALGVHNTPLEVADFIVAQLPIEGLLTNQRQVAEPFCGAGVFLAAAMRRLAELGPADMPSNERHAYLKRNLVGIEKESLALEVCRLVLTLVDYPNPNGWRLYAEDVFDSATASDLLQQSNIVLANPPFEEFSENQRQRYKSRKTGPPAEFLRRLLQTPPDMFGIVLPRSFITAPDYRDAHRQIGRAYDEVTLVELPESTFHYANVPTVLVLAHDRKTSAASITLTCSRVSKQGLSDFYNDWRLSSVRTSTVARPAENSPFTLWLNPESPLWQSLVHLPHLASVVDIHKGINWLGGEGDRRTRTLRANVVRDRPAEGFVRGCEKMEGCLQQFRIGQVRYLSIRDEDQDPRTRANRRPWERPKVVCNAARSAEPWRLRAYADSVGLAFSKQYFCAWLTDERVSIYALAAILCSPIASAFSVDHDRSRDNRIETLRQLPIPNLEHLKENSEIARLSERLHGIFGSNGAMLNSDTNDLMEMVLRLDAAILEAYGLSRVAQRDLVDRFAGKRRPTPFFFDRYFPLSFDDVVSLHDFVRVRYEWRECNERRLELIEKEYEDRLAAPESEELEELQRLAFIHTSLFTPPPLNELKKYEESHTATRETR